MDVSTGIITTVAGTGVVGFSGDGGQATSAKLNYPRGIVLDVAGNLFIADGDNSRIRRVAAEQAPMVTVRTANLAANAATLKISGTNFDPIAARNTVVFNNNAAGTVTAATSTQLTVTFSTKPASAGPLTAVVTKASGGNSGLPVTVASVVPVLTRSTASVAMGGTTLIINGFGFSTTPGNNTVVFTPAGSGTITAATSTTLTVSGLGGLKAGVLNAVVTTSGRGSGTATQVGTIIPPPTVTLRTANLAANAATLKISGTNFDPNPANNTVVFNNNAAGTVTAATSTQLTVTFSTKPASAGPLTAVVTKGTWGNSGLPVTVASVVPVVTRNPASLAMSATTLTITGFGFSTTPENNTVVFTPAGSGTITAATSTTLTVSGLGGLKAGVLNAVVTTSGRGSGTATQVGTIIPPPTVTVRTANLAANAATLKISGTNFDPNPANNTVVFNNNAAGTVTAATSTQLTVTFSTKPASAGPLTAVVTKSAWGNSGFPVTVASVVPVVTRNPASLAMSATTLTITGFGFSTTPGNNTVVFTPAGSGTVTAATNTSLTVSGLSGLKAGVLNAVVTTSGRGSGTPLQVGTVIVPPPMVAVSTGSLLQNATTLIIRGTGFSTTPSNSTVFFTPAGRGVVTTATSTSLTVTGLNGLKLGALNAVVTSSGRSSGASLQVATVIASSGQRVVAWGDNSSGQTDIPAGLSGVTAIAAGAYHTVALKTDGTVVAWGATDLSKVPVGLTGVTALAAGDWHTVALKNDGRVVAWGSNDAGQTTIPAGLSGVIAIAAGSSHTLALKNNGTVVAWGDNWSFQTDVPLGLNGVIAISAGSSNSVALKNDGTAVAWGGPWLEENGIPAGLSGVTAVAAGEQHSVALKNNGTVVVWGDNTYGQRDVPAGLSGVIAISAGNCHTVALRLDGTIVGWGMNWNGEIDIPRGLSGASAISAGYGHNAALVNPGSFIALPKLGITTKNLNPNAAAMMTADKALDPLTANHTGTANPNSMGAAVEAKEPIGVVAGPVEWTGSYALPSLPSALSSTDTDGDGVVDLLELAFGLHPRQVDAHEFTAASGRGLPAAAMSTGSDITNPKLRITFPRRRDRVSLGLSYAPLFSSSLEQAGVPGTEISTTPVAGNDTWEIVVVEDPGDLDGQGRRFATVRVGL